MGKGSQPKAGKSKYQKKLAKRQEKKVAVKETVKAEVEAAAAPEKKEAFQYNYRKHHKETYLWDAIPLKRDDKPVIFPKLTAYQPVRTRDGRPAYIEEIDVNRSKHQCVIVHIADAGHPGKYIRQEVSLNGMFSISDEPMPMDILNVSPQAWNKKFEEGLVAIRADEREVPVRPIA